MSPNLKRPLASPLRLHLLRLLFAACACAAAGAWTGEAPGRALRERVRVWLADDRPLPALAAATEAVAREPGSAAAWSALAGALFRNADFEGAEGAARRALALDSGDAEGLVALARCLETQGCKEEARTRLEQALVRDGRLAVALRLLEGLLDINTERARAIELNRRFVALDPPGTSGRLFARHASRMTGLLEALGQLELDAQPPWRERPAEIVLPLQVTEEGLFVEIVFEGQKGGRRVRRSCLFDTGEESITLTRQTAEAFGVQKVGALPSSTINGIEEMTLVMVPKVSAGEFSLSNTLAGIGTADIVGPALFAGYRVKMDFSARRLVLARQPADVKPGPDDLKNEPKGARRARFRCFGKTVWVAVHTPREAAPLKRRVAWGLLDTGCTPPALLLPRYLQALKSEPGKGPAALPFRASLEGAAHGGDTEQVLHVLPEFRLGLLGGEADAGGALSALSAASVSQATEAELDIVVGWPVIRRIFKSLEIDFERCVLTYEPRRD